MLDARTRIGRAVPLAALCWLAAQGCSQGDPGAVLAEAPGQDAGESEAAGQVEAGFDAQLEAATEEVAPKPLPHDANASRLSAMLKKLSVPEMRGRKSGTADGTATEDWLIAELAGAGIEVKTQSLTFPNHVAKGPVSLALLDGAEQVLDTLKYIDDFREVRFSGSGGEAKAELVFASYGLKTPTIDSYEGIDVTGRIAVILTGVPAGSGLDPNEDGALDAKLDLAYTHGAAGVVMVPSGWDGTSDQQDPASMELWALDMYNEYEPALHHEGLPAVFVHVAQTKRLVGKSAAELKTTPSYATGRMAALEIHGETMPQAQCRNVFGVLQGQDPAVGQEVIVLGAHHDHIGVGADGRVFPGAGDNASGTAIVLETALTMNESGAAPKRTMLFAFWCAEEDGLHGSLDYTVYGKPLFPLSKTRLMVQFDYMGEKDGPYLTNLDDRPMVVQFLGKEQEAAELPVMGVDWQGESASDDYGFLYRKVPAYRFLSYGDHHHRSTDTYENLSQEMVRRVADVAIRGAGAVGF